MGPLPEKIDFMPVDQADGLNGYALTRARNDAYGVEVIGIRAQSDAPWQILHYADVMPGHGFPSYEALREAFNRRFR